MKNCDARCGSGVALNPKLYLAGRHRDAEHLKAVAQDALIVRVGSVVVIVPEQYKGDGERGGGV